MSYRPQIQDITRKASGIGIVCGLEVIVGTDCTLTITAGYGFTSKGLLLHFPGGHFKYYRPFHEDVKGLLEEDSEVPVWELFERIDSHSDCTPLTPQTIDAHRFIDDKVVVLYLEPGYYHHIHPLLIEKEELWEVLNANLGLDLACLPLGSPEPEDLDLFEGEEGFPNGRQLFCAINRNTSLSPIYLMRFGFATDESECEPEEREFKIESADFEGVFKEYELIILDGLVKLQQGIDQIHQPAFYDLIPAQQREYLNKYLDYLKGNRWISFKTTARNVYIQYFHNLIKDLVTTYNELVFELCELMADCCPDENLFPCHLLLGEIEEDIAFGPSLFRNHFRHPPIYNDNRLRFQKIRFLHWRMVMLIKNFYIPFLESVDFADDHYTQIDKNDSVPPLLEDDESNEVINIKVTPSRKLCLPLGEQAIPFYYYVGEDNNSMHHFWHFDAVYCCKKQHQLSYHAEEDYSYTGNCAVKRPLAYNAYPHEYYRVEGAIGQIIGVDDPAVIDRPIEQIEDLIQRFNLGFKVLSLSIDEFLADFDGDGDFQVNSRFLGAEHIAGTEKGGYYLLVYDEFEIESELKNVVIADFWVPYCCVDVEEGEEAEEEMEEEEEEEEEGNTDDALIQGSIQDICEKKALMTTFEIGDQTVQSTATGGFSVDLPPGTYPIRLQDESLYLKEKNVTISATTKDPILIRVYRKQALEVEIIRLKNSLGWLRNTIELRQGTTVVSRKETRILLDSFTAVFPGLRENDYTVKWVQPNLTETVTVRPCQKPEKVTLTSAERAAFPPRVPGQQWEDWKGLPDRPVQDIVSLYDRIWDDRIVAIEKFLVEIPEPEQLQLAPKLNPLVFNLDLTTAQLTKDYEELMRFIQTNKAATNAKAWATLGQMTTEMYLERFALLNKDFDANLDDRLEKLPEYGVVQPDKVEDFVQSWLGKVKGFTNPAYEERLASLKLTPIKESSERISLSPPLDPKLIYGMGIKAAEWLATKGITNAQQLAEMKPAQVSTIMQEATSKSLQRLDVSSWPQQAKLVVKQDMKGLNTLQKKLRASKQ